MTKKKGAYQALDPRQEQELVHTIRDIWGPGLSQDLFGEALWHLLEDVAGFEMPCTDTIRALILRLWTAYGGGPDDETPRHDPVENNRVPAIE